MILMYLIIFKLGIEVFRSNSYFGEGTGPVLFANLNCDGTESTLSDCTYSSYYFTISHSDAGVRCNRVAVTSKSLNDLKCIQRNVYQRYGLLVQSGCSNGDVRLMNGTAPNEGRVEICYSGVWGSVCDSSWDSSDAVIVCRQMGFRRISKVHINHYSLIIYKIGIHQMRLLLEVLILEMEMGHTT